MTNTEVVVLAGGKGTRMETDLPKVLVELAGRPLVSYVLRMLEDVGTSPLVVVGYEAERVEEVLGEKYRYVHQKEQLGTGHAVLQAEKYLKDTTDVVVVLYGDHPLVGRETVANLVKVLRASESPLALATTEVEDFNDWRSAFERFGRILRGKKGKIEAIVEVKDATDEIRALKEVNPAYFAFKKDWLFEKLKHLDTDNAQGEYYLTDVIAAAFREGYDIPSYRIEPKEALGANTFAELRVLEGFL